MTRPKNYVEFQNKINRLYDKLISLEKIASANLLLLDPNEPRKIPGTPSQTSSEFLINDEQGKWAERIIRTSLAVTFPNYKFVAYGESSTLNAGDPEFNKFYANIQKELDTIGKRPDLLVFDKETGKKVPENFMGLSTNEQAQIVSTALMGLEIRSSAQLLKKYKPSKSRASLSFTAKLEDLRIVKKWIDTFGVPLFYVQVLFDSAHIISFKKILEILITNNRFTPKQNPSGVFTVANDPKNQFKTTFQIHLGQGSKFADITAMPDVIGKRLELQRGRLLHYCSLEGGKLIPDQNAFNNAVDEAKNAI